MTECAGGPQLARFGAVGGERMSEAVVPLAEGCD